MPTTLNDESSLDAVVGRRPAGAVVKEIPGFDRHCRSFAAITRMIAIGFEADTGLHEVSLAGGVDGFIEIENDQSLIVSLTGCDLPIDRWPTGDIRVGLLLMAPGIKETLRVNGLAILDPDIGCLRVEARQIFLHCAKAFMRSGLWEPERWQATPAFVDDPVDGLRITPEAGSIIGASPFLLLATDGKTSDGGDLSPRGDPAGFVEILDDSRLFIPDRPGNNRRDNFRNLLENPKIALTFLVPQSLSILRVSGTASISSDPVLLNRHLMEDRIPKVGLIVQVAKVTALKSSAIAQADLWNVGRLNAPPAFPSIAEVIADHVKLHKATSLKTKIMKAITIRPAIENYAKKDYKDNLY